jgi:hypothetical protein
MREKGRAKRGIFRLGNRARKIVLRIAKTIRQTGLLHLGIPGNPDHAARPRRGAADKFRLLDQENPQPFRGGNRGGRHPASAAADDHDIIGIGSRHHVSNSARTLV